MGMSVNKVELLGYLGGKPEVHYTPGGKAVATVSVATSAKWKDRDGNLAESTEWHKVVLWDGLAKFAGEYLDKGRQVYVSGRLATRKWEKDGATHYATEIIAAELIATGKGGNA